jgi:hypothetical protein
MDDAHFYKLFFMAIQAGGKRPFPAVVIVSLLFLACIFPGQRWVAHGFPRISGLATLTPGLVVLDIPIRLPIMIDLILVPGLFILSYLAVILIESIRRGVPVGQELTHRFGAIFAGSFILLLCLATGGLIAYGAQNYLPSRVAKGVESLGINADLYLGQGPIHFHGNFIFLAALAIGLACFLNRIKKAPEIKPTVQLTREQRMTPYQRMLQQKREQKQEQEKPRAPRPRPIPVDKKVPGRQRTQRRAGPAHSLCCNQPLLSLEPEAVNYRPL